MAELRLIRKVPALPPRPEAGHKGLFGRVLVVGGHEQMIGAPVLAGTAALRMGAGLVQIALPQSVLPQALSITPELIGLGLKGSSARGLVEAGEQADALLIGPGLGQSAIARSHLMRLLKLDKPMVLDADALNLLAKEPKWPAGAKCRAVLTPHPGEMGRLLKWIPGKPKTVPTDAAGRLEIAGMLARSVGQIVVLKGHATVITDGQSASVNRTGDSTLSKAGTGDVLSGMLGCLLGQRMELLEASILAVYLHGLAGEIAGRRFGRRSALAREIVDCIHAAIAKREAGI